MTRLGAAVARWEAAAAAAEAAIQEMDEKPQAAITDAFPGGTTPRRNKRKNRA
jgi:hypothetical protein